LRSTAAELTRGAVEVARGVWDGLRAAKGPSTPTLVREAPTPRAGSGAPALEGAALEQSRLEPDGPTPLDSAPAASAARLPRPATIPVPPRAAGGWLGTLFATVGLAAEVFGSLLRGVVMHLGGLFVRTHRRLVARSSSRVGKALRLAVFYGGVVLLALLVLEAATQALR
jgi:predicted lipid-binding transport protein (Tim44 family)